MSIQNPKMGQGPAKELSGSELEKDTNIGFTNPNLHRRVDPKSPVNPNETCTRDYSIGIYSTNSYRTTTVYLHDEDSIDSEIP